MFEDSTFESTGRIRTRSRRWMIAAFTINGSILLVLVLLPLVYPDAIPRVAVPHLIAVPTVVSEPPKPEHPRPILRDTMATTTVWTERPAILPKPVNLGTVAAGPPTDVQIAMDGGPDITGGANNPFGRGSGPRVVQQAVAPKGPTQVSRGVMAGRLLSKITPGYPAIARAARVEGTVVLQAIISKSGAIENLRVISGPAMLQQAAIDAVKQWRYQPYELDGQPVEVETTINVVFTLGR